MHSLLFSPVTPGNLLGLVTLDLDALIVYGLVALVLGLIGWSKYTEPPVSLPHPVRSGAAGADRAPANPVARLSPGASGPPATGPEPL